MPAERPRPPVVAESSDPFATLRVIDLVARLPRGRAIALGEIVDLLNASYLDWLFEPRVIADAILQLQVNWMADYRNTSGIVLDELRASTGAGAGGGTGGGAATVTIEDSSRVDPWIVRQAQRAADACREALVEFSLRDRTTGE